jgi:hypothetical protein
MCTKVDGRKKVIVTMGYNLEKHEGKKICDKDGVPYPRLEIGNVYIKKDCKHLKNQALWIARHSAPRQVLRGLHGKTNKKGIQFSTSFQVLSNGCPMVDYCESQHLLKHPDVKMVPRKH